MAHRKLKSDRKNRPGGALQLRLSSTVSAPRAHQDSYVNFYEEVYEQRWYRKLITYPISGGVMQRVPQGSLQADSALTRRHEQKPQEC